MTELKSLSKLPSYLLGDTKPLYSTMISARFPIFKIKYFYSCSNKHFIISQKWETLRVPLSIPQINLGFFPDCGISQGWQG